MGSAIASHGIVVEMPGRGLQRIRFGEYLVEKHLLNDEQLIAALADHWSNGGCIGAAISRSGFLAPEEVEREAALYHDLDVIEV